MVSFEQATTLGWYGSECGGDKSSWLVGYDRLVHAHESWPRVKGYALKVMVKW